MMNNNVDIMDKMIEYESGSMSEQKIIDFFQELYRTGMWHNFQGLYGRTLSALIKAGKIKIFT